MATRDLLVLNTTGSNFENLQAGDTARIKGSGTKTLSVEKTDGTSIVQVDTSNSQIILGELTSSFNISGSSTSTASFGRIISPSLSGDGSDSTITSTLTRSANTISSSAQIADDISGSFAAGFSFGVPTSSFFTGVSGSTFHIAGKESSSFCGSDYHHNLQYSLGHIFTRPVWDFNAPAPMENRHTASFGGTPQYAQLNQYVNRLGPTKTLAQSGFTSIVGTQEGALAFGGYQSPGNCKRLTDCYDGVSWSQLGDMVQDTATALGVGTPYAAFSADAGTATEKWNGTSWASSTLSPASQCKAGAAGTQNSAIYAGGYIAPASVAGTEHFNGQTWSEGGDMSNTRSGVKGLKQIAGFENSAVVFGEDSPACINTELYDGNTWASAGNLLAYKYRGTGAGTQNDAIARLGYGVPTYSTVHKHINGWAMSFDGTSWTWMGWDAYNRCGDGASDGTAGNSISIQNVPATTAAVFTDRIYHTTASFGRIEADSFTGDATKISSSLIQGSGIASSSAQLADDISGSFTGGFGFTGHLESPTDIYSGVWSLASTMINGRGVRGSIDGTCRDDGVIFAGYGTPTCTEEYNGTVWSQGGALSDAKAYTAGAGLSTNAALSFGGTNTAATEHYDGSSWSEGGDMPFSRHRAAGTGTQNAALSIGGQTPSLNAYITGSTVEYDGSAWSSGGNLSDARTMLEGTGLQNASVAIGGCNPAFITSTENYDGSTWATGVAEVSSMRCHMVGGGSQNSFLAQGGSPSNVTSLFDGLTFRTGPDSIFGRRGSSGWGARGSVVLAGGSCTYMTTEHYDENLANTGSFGRVEAKFVGDAKNIASTLPRSAGLVSSSAQLAENISGSFTNNPIIGGNLRFKYPNAGVWSALTSLNSTSNYVAGAGGSSEAVLQFGGGCNNSDTEEWNGSSWSEVAALNTGRGGGVGAGIQNAAIYHSSYGNAQCTEIWNGTAWSEVADRLSAGRYAAGVGTQNAAQSLETGLGHEQWDGSSWSECVDKLNIGQCQNNFGGAIGSSVNASVNGFGWAGPAGTNFSNVTHYYQSGSGIYHPQNIKNGLGYFGHTMEWNGTSFSLGGNVNIPRAYVNHGGGGGAGSVNNGMVAGGYNTSTAPVGSPYILACSEHYDGTTWSNASDLPAGVRAGASTSQATLSSAMWFAGSGTASPYVYKYDDGPGTNFTASIGRLEFTSASGDGSGLADAFAIGKVSSSAQIALDISSSFISGGLSVGASMKDFFSGVSGSSYYFAGCEKSRTDNYVTASFCGSDFSHISQYEKGHLRGGILSGVWSSGGDLTTARFEAGGAGVENAGFIFGGRNPGYIATTEVYNGSSWSSGNDLLANSGYNQGVGTIYAALSISGEPAATSHELYDGSSWSEISNSPAEHGQGAATGTVNAANAMGHNYPASSAGLEQWNGNVWTEGPIMANNEVQHHSGAGLQNSTVIYGGINALDCTEHFDGSAWSAGGALNTGRRGVNGGAGGETHAMYAGGMTPTIVSATEHYDGSAWTSGGNLPASIRSNTNFGNSDKAISTGGYPAVAETYHYTANNFNMTASFTNFNIGKLTGNASFLSSSYAVGKISGSAQLRASISGAFLGAYMGVSGHISGAFTTASFGRIEADRFFGDATLMSSSILEKLPAGTVSGAAQIASEISGAFTSGFENKGNINSPALSAWVSIGNNPNNSVAGAGFGNYNSMIVAGGVAPNDAGSSLWNGVTWDAGPSISYAVSCSGDTGFGSQNVGGFAGGCHGTTEGCDGLQTAIISNNTWTQGSNKATNTIHSAGTGCTIDSGIIVGGLTAAYLNSCFSASCLTEEFNGETWSSAANSNNKLWFHTMIGSQNASLVALTRTINDTSGSAISEEWDGTTWTSGPNLNNARFGGGGGGSQNNANVHAGRQSCTAPLGNLCCTERYDGVAWSNVASAPNNVSETFLGTSTGAGTQVTHNGGGLAAATTYHETLTKTTGSFGIIRPVSKVSVKNYRPSGSTFRIPLFAHNPQTGSAGQMWFNTFEKALYWTFASSSISQSLGAGGAAGVTSSFETKFIVSNHITGSAT